MDVTEKDVVCVCHVDVMLLAWEPRDPHDTYDMLVYMVLIVTCFN